MAIANSDFRLKLSVSSEGFPCKPTKTQIPTLRFTRRNLTVDEFSNLISKGHCFCHWFNSNRQEFGLSEKKDCNFNTANVVFIDVDKSELEMNQLVSQLFQKPTVYYTTPSNLTAAKERKYCFRLCYAFDEDISGAAFKALYNAIVKSIKKDVPSYNNEDNCGGKVSQYMNGNGSSNCEIHATDRIYAISDFDWQPASEQDIVGKACERLNRQRLKAKVSNQPFEYDPQMISDLYESKATNGFLKKYSDRFTYFDRTPIDFKGQSHYMVPEDYVEIRRGRFRDYQEDDEGNVKEGGIYVQRVRNGHRRRKLLYISCLLRRLMKPTVTFEELLYCIVFDVVHFYDNSDRALTPKELIRIVDSALKVKQEDIHIKGGDKREFIVNKEYARKHGMSPKSLANHIRRERTEQEVLELYDINQSVAANRILLKENGIEKSLSTLYRICHTHGIPTKGASHSSRVGRR